MSHGGFAPGILYKGENIDMQKREDARNQYKEAREDETKSMQNT